MLLEHPKTEQSFLAIEALFSWSLVKGKLAGEILYNVNYFSILKDNFGIETKTIIYK
jgi:hypothetical protein